MTRATLFLMFSFNKEPSSLMGEKGTTRVPLGRKDVPQSGYFDAGIYGNKGESRGKESGNKGYVGVCVNRTEPKGPKTQILGL